MSLNKEFLNNPVLFCKKYALQPKGFQCEMKNQNGYYSVPSDSRIKWCKITQGARVFNGFQTPTNGSCCTAMIHYEAPAEKEKSSWFPIFYLPWEIGKTYRITLKNKQNIPEPKIFITSEVNACSVFVQGSREHPTVYHVNNKRSSTSAPKSGSHEKKWEEFFKPKEKVMTGWVKNAKLPKSMGKNPLLKTQKVVHAREYMDLMQKHQPQLKERGKDYIKENIRDSYHNAKKFKFNEKPTYSPCGTIFGYCKDSKWTFYYQKKATMKFSYLVASSNETLSPKETLFMQYAISCHEFWPNGKGQVFG